MNTIAQHALVCGLAVLGTLEVNSAQIPSAPLAYDFAAYELAPQFKQSPVPWNAAEVKQSILERVAFEKQRREMDVYYYRIGYTMAFPLGLAQRPHLEDFPAPLPRSKYPWLIWLSWNLEERWRLFNIAWRQFGDVEAGQLLQKELAALAGWDRFAEVDNNIGLLTGHFAASLAIALADTSTWNKEALQKARTAAESLIERDVWPWFEKNWREKELTTKDLHNIPAIALVRSAQLARVIGSPRAAALDVRSRQVFRAWCRYRIGAEKHTEGTIYDGYLMDSITEWLAGLPDREELLKEARSAFRDLADHYIYLTLPGRVDLQAPVGDVEPEMTFWATVLIRLAAWYEWPEAAWTVQRIPLPRLRAPALIFAFNNPRQIKKVTVPKPGPREHPNAVSLRTGWNADDLLAVVCLSRSNMGHLQADSGQLILGWQGRFWITDPGYQQYRPGEERDFSLGLQAHNPPVIYSTNQTQRAGQLQLLETLPDKSQHVRLDLTQCYKGLPKTVSVQREVWMKQGGDGMGVVARDIFSGFGPDVVVTNHWHGGTHLAWAFRDGWVRLSDGERTLWITTSPGKLEPAQLTRHPGSRGPLTMVHSAKIPEGENSRWWVFWCDPKGGWNPPGMEANPAELKIQAPGETGAGWTIRPNVRALNP